MWSFPCPVLVQSLQKSSCAVVICVVGWQSPLEGLDIFKQMKWKCLGFVFNLAFICSCKLREEVGPADRKQRRRDRSREPAPGAPRSKAFNAGLALLLQQRARADGAGFPASCEQGFLWNMVTNQVVLMQNNSIALKHFWKLNCTVWKQGQGKVITLIDTLLVRVSEDKWWGIWSASALLLWAVGNSEWLLKSGNVERGSVSVPLRTCQRELMLGATVLLRQKKTQRLLLEESSLFHSSSLWYKHLGKWGLQDEPGTAAAKTICHWHLP